ncbi:CGNR zinc finger domain-containing protein [Ktedonosporobacter rubrisoli]|nr:ABATE domain-containing protein [Ktedonosporobacter rubrisoli]
MLEEGAVSEEKTRGKAGYALFLSGSLALDLVNTEMIVRGKKRDVLSSPDTLSHWWQEALVHHPEHVHVEGEELAISWTPELLEEVKKLRQTLRTLFTHLIEAQAATLEDLEALNQILSLGYQSLQQTTRGTIIVVYRTHDQQKGRILLPIVLSAFQLLTEGERQRLHKCKNERCILFFYDTTKSGTRQWCSLECLNRSRSIRHYQQLKKQPSQK